MEGTTVEYKMKLTDNFEKEVVAFLNSIGGELYIGVSNDGAVSGIKDADKLSLVIIDRIKTTFSLQHLVFLMLM